MNILQIEQERANLKEKLTAQYSAQARLLFLFSFFDKVLVTEDKNLINAFLPEFISEYVFCLKNFSVLGLKPRIHELVIEQAEKIEKNGFVVGYNDFAETIQRLKDELEKLQRILNGERAETPESKAYFPLLEEEAIKETGVTVGILESVTIKINPTKTNHKFIIVPSEKEIEEKISEQVKLSWLNAVRVAKKHIKRIHPYHEVIISFDKKAGFCKGNSLGTALTLSFIEEIFKTYNSPLSIKVGDGIAFTGGMDEQGTITETSKDIIKQKTEIIFFSDITVFIVPKKEEDAANEKLNELRKEFPKRDIKIIGVENINDLLDRRTIVEIKKQAVIVRGAKFVKKNWVAVSSILVLSAIISFFIIRDIDTNPVAFRVDGSYVYLLNKNGKVLWQKRANTNESQIENPINLKEQIKIVDIDSDGRNELLITIEDFVEAKPDSEFSRISCYDSKGIPIWRYSFKDKVSSERTELPSDYAIAIIDTLSLETEKYVFLYANNVQSFSSAIFRLDLKTGERLPGTLWCSGHTYSGLLKDINKDGNTDILCVGLDNGFEDAVLFGFTVDTLTKVRPTTDSYLIRGFSINDLITYIRFPKTDYDIYRNYRTPGIHTYGFKDVQNSEYYQFIVDSHMDEYASTLWYQIDYNFKDVNAIIDNRFRVMRDTLVAHGKLQLPYTDTPEYVELIKNKILYWKNGEWVKREELK